MSRKYHPHIFRFTYLRHGKAWSVKDTGEIFGAFQSESDAVTAALAALASCSTTADRPHAGILPLL